MAKIFICYRREDSAPAAGRICDWLKTGFPGDEVFLDVDKTPVGVDFRDYLSQKVRDADLVLAIIGRDWLGRHWFSRRRLYARNDYVRTEIEIALEQHIPLIPVLLDGTQMPAPNKLPNSIKRIAYLNAATVHSADGRFKSDIAHLIGEIKGKIGPAAGERAPGPKTASVPPAAHGADAAQPPAPTVADGPGRTGVRRPRAVLRMPRLPPFPRVKPRYVLAALGAFVLLFAGYSLAPGLLARLDQARAVGLIAQAGEAVSRGDEAAMNAALERAKALAPALAVQFNRDRAAAAEAITQAHAALDRGDEPAVAQALARAGALIPDLVPRFNQERAKRAAAQIAQARAALERGDAAGVDQALTLANGLAPDLVTRFNRERAAAAITQARAAFGRGDEAAATQALDQARGLAPDLAGQVDRERAAATDYAEQAMKAFTTKQGDKAAASRALRQAADLAPDLAVKYSRDYAKFYRDLAAQTAVRGVPDPDALAEATWWEAKAQELIARQTKRK